MGSLFELLDKAEKRPGIYIGYDDTQPALRLRGLEMLLAGYEYALHENGVVEPGLHFYKDFNAYLRGCFGWSMSCGAIVAIRDHAADDAAAWRMFFNMVRDFRTAQHEGVERDSAVSVAERPAVCEAAQPARGTRHVTAPITFSWAR